MNVYDFDGTLYHGDSSIDFYKFCLKKNPAILKFWPKQTRALYLYKRGKISKTQMKEVFYLYFTELADIDSLIDEFWNKNKKKIYDWYFIQQKPDDVIISASPEFLIKPIGKILGINTVIASKVNKLNGKHSMENCWGEEKVNRMKKEIGHTNIDAFFSDSNSDLPLALLSKKAFKVDKKGRVTLWKF